MVKKVIIGIMFFLLSVIYWETCIRKELISTGIHDKTKIIYSLDTMNIANVIYSECSICPLSEKLLIGSIPINRLKDGRWGKSLDEVIFSPNQFYQANGGKNWKTNEECLNIARFIMIYGPVDSLPLYFFQSFEKSFTKKLTVLYKEKYHIFATNKHK